jgi:signal transduction histidine kinase
VSTLFGEGGQALSQPHIPSPGPERSWLAGHKQRLAWVLVALTTASVASAAAAGGLLLHRAAEIERQALRTQRLGSTAFQLQDALARSDAGGGVTPTLAAEQRRVLLTTGEAYRLVRRHDPAEGARLGPYYAGFVRSSTAAFARARAGTGHVPAAEQRALERRLNEFESRVDVEMQRLARGSRVTNPRARMALIIALAAAVLLVALLIWQFELQRRSGRIDRDNAERSRELIRLRDQFVASVSHELRTPLTSILGYLELIREKDAGPHVAEDGAYLEVIARNAERLLRLVSDLLLVAEMEGGRLTLQLADVDIGLLAAECVDALRPETERRRISLVLTEDSSASLPGDPIRLAQMMDNLVSNAIKFTPEGGRVKVRASTREGEALFEVTDTGPGISASDQSLLFDPFFRTKSAQVDGIKGTGLGLTITKAIVEAHHGSITVESHPGAGTTFRIRLPRDQPFAITSGRAAEAGHAA